MDQSQLKKSLNNSSTASATAQEQNQYKQQENSNGNDIDKNKFDKVDLATSQNIKIKVTSPTKDTADPANRSFSLEKAASLILNHEEMMRKSCETNTESNALSSLQALDKEDSFVVSSPTRSILKRGDSKGGETKKSKNVVFSSSSLVTEQVFRDNIPLEFEEEHKMSSFHPDVRQRSKSSSLERPSALPGNVNIPKPLPEPVKSKAIVRNLSVGRVQDGVAILLTEDFNVVEVPLSMLPMDVRKGNILKFTVERAVTEEEARKENIKNIQSEILSNEDVYDDYNRRMELLKKQKFDIPPLSHNYLDNIQRLIEEVNDDVPGSFILDKSALIDDKVKTNARVNVNFNADRK